jgi:periplasmic divalent cation tolerance protein
MSHHSRGHGEGGEHRHHEPEVRVLLSTCPPADAERLAAFLVERGLAACVNIVPGVTSVYRWEGKVTRDAESLLVIKCPKHRVDEVTKALVEEHPYDVPEVIALKVKGGHAPYLSWVADDSKGE